MIWRRLLLLLLLPLFAGDVFAQTLTREHLALVNPLEYGASCSTATLNAALAAIGSNRRRLLITATDRAKVACTWAITSNVTVPANVILDIPQGSAVSVSASFTLTLTARPLVDRGVWYTGTVVVLEPSLAGSFVVPYAASGCLPAVPGSGLTLAAFACTGLTRSPAGDGDFAVQAAAAVTMSGGAGTYWLLFHWDTTTAISGWTRASSTHYLWQKSATQPTIPSTGQLLARLTVVGSDITRVEDLRKPSSWARAGVYDLTDVLYGGAGDAVLGGSGTDNVNPWLVVSQAIAAQGGGMLYIPPGIYKFSSKPGALWNGVIVQCSGILSTTLLRAYTESTANQGFLDMNVAATTPASLSNAGGGVQDCGLYAETGTTGGAAVALHSDATAQQKQVLLDRLYIYGAGTWAYDVYMSGSAKTSAPKGLQDIRLRASTLTASTTAGLAVYAAFHVSVDETTVTGNSGECLIADGASSIQSQWVTVRLLACDKATIGVNNDMTDMLYSAPKTTTLTVGSHALALTTEGIIATLTGTPGLSSALGHLVAFTPTIFGSSGAGVTTYTAREGWYARSAHVAHVQVYAAWTNQTGTGNLRVGLPFTTQTGSGNRADVCSVHSTALNYGSGKQLTALVAQGTTDVVLYADDPAGGATAEVAIDTAATLWLSCVLHVTP